METLHRVCCLLLCESKRTMVFCHVEPSHGSQCQRYSCSAEIVSERNIAVCNRCIDAHMCLPSYIDALDDLLAAQTYLIGVGPSADSLQRGGVAASTLRAVALHILLTIMMAAWHSRQPASRSSVLRRLFPF